MGLPTIGWSKRGRRDAPDLLVALFSISCSFWENLAKSYVGTPWRVGAPRGENPRSATAKITGIKLCVKQTRTNWMQIPFLSTVHLNKAIPLFH